MVLSFGMFSHPDYRMFLSKADLIRIFLLCKDSLCVYYIIFFKVV